MIIKEIDYLIDPFYNLKGEFQLLLLDYNKNQIFSDNIEIYLGDYRIINIFLL